MTAQEQQPETSVQVIGRMMRLLEVMAAHDGPVALKQLAAQTGLHPSTAHRILASMLACRFIERDEPGTYRLGLRLLELGNLVQARLGSRREAAASLTLMPHAPVKPAD